MRPHQHQHWHGIFTSTLCLLTLGMLASESVGRPLEARGSAMVVRSVVFAVVDPATYCSPVPQADTS